MRSLSNSQEEFALYSSVKSLYSPSWKFLIPSLNSRGALIQARVPTSTCGPDYGTDSQSSSGDAAIQNIARRTSSVDTSDDFTLNAYFKKNIRPLLDIVDKLRTLNVMDEGIQLPTIVVVGDQSSGKSSVLESLARVNLPRGDGIVTRVPLILRLQNCSPEQSKIVISYNDVAKDILEDDIESAVESATNYIGGNCKGVSNVPISLHIQKSGCPDLTMVDLPGITRVPVHGQPEDIYEQTKDMVETYIKPEKTIILNVLPASVDFSTCESIRLSQMYDREGKRTLGVVTKVDKSPEGLNEKIISDNVKIGLGYICVINMIGDSSHEAAREKEKWLFQCHHLLSKLDKRYVGIPNLAELLVRIQVGIIRSSLPGITKQIGDQLLERRKELEYLSKETTNLGAAMSVFYSIRNGIKRSIETILRGDYTEFPDDSQMHIPARMDELFCDFGNRLKQLDVCLLPRSKTAGILDLLKETKGVGLVNFLSTTVFRQLVGYQLRSVEGLSKSIVHDLHNYILDVVLKVTDKYTADYENLKACYVHAGAFVLNRILTQSSTFVERMLEKERNVILTLNECYVETHRKMRSKLDGVEGSSSISETFYSKMRLKLDGVEGSSSISETLKAMFYRKMRSKLDGVEGYSSISETLKAEGSSSISETLKAFGTYTNLEEVDEGECVVDLDDVDRELEDKVGDGEYHAAWEMKVSLIEYWIIIRRRFADEVAMELRYAFQKALVDEIDDEILGHEFTRPESLLTLMLESPSTGANRARLVHSVNILQECSSLCRSF